MKLENLIIFMPGAIASTLLKIVRLNMTDEVNKMAVDKGLYHFVPNEEVGHKILESGKILSAKGALGIIDSYGTPAAVMFLGVPELENYLKNLSNFSDNKVLNPEQIMYAVKFNPKLEEMSNYKSRMVDNVIIHEGDCIIPPERTSITQFVLDLQKDEQGNIIYDSQGYKQIGLRERTKEEIERDGDKYTPSQEFLEALESYKERNGYIKNDILKLGNRANTLLHVGSIEAKYTLKNSIKFIKDFIKRITKPQKEIDENQNTKVHRVTKGIEQGQVETKKSVRDKKYVNNIIEFSKQGIKQQNLSKVLPEFLQSREGNFLKQKMNDFTKDPVTRKGIHGINHSNRVTSIALILAQREGLNLDDRMLDILATAGYYHDIGRIADVGPHAKRSARLVEKKQLKHIDGKPYSKEDMSILKTLIDAHEGTEKKATKMPQKYGVKEEDLEKTMKMVSIIRDADALDRARLSSKDSMDLNPKYLRTKSSKELIDFSFQFEALTRKVKDFSSILSYDPNKELQSENTLEEERNEFIKDLQKGVPDMSLSDLSIGDDRTDISSPSFSVTNKENNRADDSLDNEARDSTDEEMEK